MTDTFEIEHNAPALPVKARGLCNTEFYSKLQATMRKMEVKDLVRLKVGEFSPEQLVYMIQRIIEELNQILSPEIRRKRPYIFTVQRIKDDQKKITIIAFQRNA